MVVMTDFTRSKLAATCRWRVSPTRDRACNFCLRYLPRQPEISAEQRYLTILLYLFQVVSSLFCKGFMIIDADDG